MTAYSTPLYKFSIKSLFSSQVAHQARAYPGFLSMKQLGVLLSPPPPPSLDQREISDKWTSLGQGKSVLKKGVNFREV